MHLIVIRHAQTEANALGQISSLVPGPDLSPVGVQQAEAVADALAAEPITAVYASATARAQQTAAPLAERLGVPVGVLEGLNEVSAGVLEGRADDAALRAYGEALFAWWTSYDARLPGGEDGHQFFRRFSGAIERIADRRDRRVALFSHAGAIRTWASGVSRNLDPAFSLTHGLDNIGIVRLEGDPVTGWRAVEWAGEPVPETGA